MVRNAAAASRNKPKTHLEPAWPANRLRLFVIDCGAPPATRGPSFSIEPGPGSELRRVLYPTASPYCSPPKSVIGRKRASDGPSPRSKRNPMRWLRKEVARNITRDGPDTGQYPKYGTAEIGIRIYAT